MHSPGDILLGRFRIISILGKGSYGIVYLVRDLTSDLRRKRLLIAAKHFDFSFLPQDEMSENLKLFEREVEILRELRNPGIAAFPDSFREGSSHYILMEYVEGRTLDEIIRARGRPFTPGEVIPLALQLADILRFLHGQKPHPVIFRDLKPSNVMLAQDGKIKLIDFGIARYFKPGKTKDTYFLGTPGFSAPEQYGFGQSDPRSDIYSLGATL